MIFGFRGDHRPRVLGTAFIHPNVGPSFEPFHANPPAGPAVNCAFDELVRRYRDRVFRLCTKILRHEDDAAEALHDPDLLSVAVRSADAVLLPIVADGFDRPSTSPYDVACVVTDLDRLASATGQRPARKP